MVFKRMSFPPFAVLAEESSVKEEKEDPVEVDVIAYVLCFGFFNLVFIDLYCWLRFSNGIGRVCTKLKSLLFILKEYGCVVMRLASNGVVTYFMYVLIKSVGEVLKSERDRIHDSKSYVTPLEGMVWVLSCTFYFAVEMIEAESLFGDLRVSMCPADKPIPYIEAIEGVILTICGCAVVGICMGGLLSEREIMLRELNESRLQQERDRIGTPAHTQWFRTHIRSLKGNKYDIERFVANELTRRGWRRAEDPAAFEAEVDRYILLYGGDLDNNEINRFQLKCKNDPEYFSWMIGKYDEKICPICLEGPLMDNPKNRDLYMTECGHKFHFDCFNEYYCSYGYHKTRFGIPCVVCREFGEGCKLLDLGNKNKNHSHNNEPRHCPDE